MKNIQKISIFMLAISGFAFAQDTQNEEEELSTVEALLALVKEGKTAEQAANADRESKFIANKNKQASILAAEKRELASHENANTVIKEAEIQKKKFDNFNYLYEELHFYVLIAALYFIFLLPVFNKMMMKYVPFGFGDDKNLNLQGSIIKSVLFGVILYILNKLMSIVSEY